MLIALVVAACLAALIAFYSVLVRNATLVEPIESGMPGPAMPEPEVEYLRRAA